VVTCRVLYADHKLVIVPIVPEEEALIQAIGPSLYPPIERERVNMNVHGLLTCIANQ